ncbi:hypothetical protein TNCV_1233051 [Trichonephila clavipes]|nr:hypothetical protein TNCV_1233051 [Trichonephila clavipes]
MGPLIRVKNVRMSKNIMSMFSQITSNHFILIHRWMFSAGQCSQLALSPGGLKGMTESLPCLVSLLKHKISMHLRICRMRSAQHMADGSSILISEDLESTILGYDLKFLIPSPNEQFRVHTEKHP